MNSIIISKDGKVLEALAGGSLEIKNGTYTVRNMAGFVTMRAELPKGASVEFEPLK